MRAAPELLLQKRFPQFKPARIKIALIAHVGSLADAASALERGARQDDATFASNMNSMLHSKEAAKKAAAESGGGEGGAGGDGGGGCGWPWPPLPSGSLSQDSFASPGTMPSTPPRASSGTRSFQSPPPFCSGSPTRAEPLGQKACLMGTLYRQR